MSGQNECGNCILVENRFWHVDYCNECEYCINRGSSQFIGNSFTDQDVGFFEGIDFSLSQEAEAENDNVFDEVSVPQQEEWLEIDSNIDFDEIFNENDIECFCNSN